MTREQIEVMPAGEAIDEMIAGRLFGIVKCSGHEPVDCPNQFNHAAFKCKKCGAFKWASDNRWQEKIEIPCYSTDIAAAWEVVEKFTKDKIDVNVQYLFEGECDNGVDWNCLIGESMLEADTAPLAICRAALLTTL